MAYSKPRLSPFSLSRQFVFDTSPNKVVRKSSLWFVFHNDGLLVQQGDGGEITPAPTPPSGFGFAPEFSRYIGNYGGADIYAAELSKAITLPKTFHFIRLRKLFGKMDRDFFALAGRAIQIIHWNRDHRFCGRCGTKMKIRRVELSKICPACKFISFPRLSPAVIMSVVRGKEILLARSPRFPAGMYSTLAGFVEPGETLEETVAREVREEVNVEVCNIRYIDSQPWPFPHSLMIGFSAQYAGGDIRVDNNEIEDAQWFSRDNLPLLPTRMSIARHLIELFIKSGG